MFLDHLARSSWLVRYTIYYSIIHAILLQYLDILLLWFVVIKLSCQDLDFKLLMFKSWTWRLTSQVFAQWALHLRFQKQSLKSFRWLHGLMWCAKAEQENQSGTARIVNSGLIRLITLISLILFHMYHMINQSWMTLILYDFIPYDIIWSLWDHD